EYTLSLQWTPIIPDKYLRIFPDSLEVNYEAGSSAFSVKATVKWDVTDNAVWLTASKIDENTIGVSYDENLSTAPRTAMIIARGPEGLADTSVVIQAGAPAYLDVSPNSLNVSYEAGSDNFTVSANVTWDVSDDAPWLTAVKANESTISVSYDTNLYPSPRSAVITASGAGGVSETVTVIQDGAPAYLEISPKVLNVSYESDSAIFDVITNVDWSVTDNASWLIAIKADESTIKVFYFTNNSSSSRTATISAAGDEGLGDTVRVIQLAKNMHTTITTPDKDEIHIYPNPSTGLVYIELPDAEKEKYIIQIIDPAGKVLMNKPFLNRSILLKACIDLEMHPAGIYYVKVFNNSSVIVKKILLINRLQ
ncbi:MAG TPA: T9SS type A sorting domain-containing protein, partial [Bacteroidaceae bacterium]|nr:T9SS type A sorting domain-containing protein [Bacteroidaceae bacterium]